VKTKSYQQPGADSDSISCRSVHWSSRGLWWAHTRDMYTTNKRQFSE